MGKMRTLFLTACILTSLLSVALPAQAQQARGLFFSLYGSDASPAEGDYNHVQAIYFDIPENHEKPYYLRIFDADTGGYLDRRVGNAFNTRMRFLVLGGNSANETFGGNPETRRKGVQAINFANEDVIYSRVFGADAQVDGRYVNLGELKPEDGFDLGDGYRRFVLLVISLEGNDGNYFDLALSHNPNDKEEPEDYRWFVKDLTLRTPPWEGHAYQVIVPTNGQNQFTVGTFSLGAQELTVNIPFQESLKINPSNSGNWVFNTIRIPNAEFVSHFGITLLATEQNNTFSLIVLDKNGKPVSIPLPISEYEPVTEPIITYKPNYHKEDQKKVTLVSEIRNGDDFTDIDKKWVVKGDTLRGASVTINADSLGFLPYELIVGGNLGGMRRYVAFQDSVLLADYPTPWAGSDRIFVPGIPMAFDGTVSEPFMGRIASYHWDFGDGNTARGARVDHTFRNPGMYRVRLTVMEDNQTPFNIASDSIRVWINSPPVPRIEAPIAAQIGEEITISGSESYSEFGEIVSFQWEIDGETFTGEEVSYQITQNRPFEIKLTVRDNSGTFNALASATHNIRINRPPIANAGDDKHVSPGNPVTYDGSGSFDPDGRIARHEWIFEDAVVEGSVVRHALDRPGMHDVVLRVTDNEGAVGYDTMQVRVNFPPVPIITGNPIVNSGRVQLSGAESYDEDGEIIRYQWALGDGTVRVGKEIEHIYRRPGTYQVVLTVVDDSRTLSSVQRDTMMLTVNQLPVARIDAVERIPKGGEITFDGTRSYDPDGEISAFMWDFGDGNTARGSQVTHRFENPGTYQVQLTVRDDSGLEDAIAFAYHEVYVNAPPVLVADYPRRAEPGTPVKVDLSDSYSPNGGLLSYLWKVDGEWKNGDATRKFVFRPGNNNTIQFAVADDAGLENSITTGEARFQFNESPVAVANDDIRTHRRTIIFDGSRSFDPDGDELRYFWDFGDGNHKTGPIVVHTYRFGGTFQAILTVDDQQGLENSQSSDTVNVFINRPPEVFFQTPGVVCVQDTVMFDGSMTYDPDGNESLSYVWEFGDGSVAQSKTVGHRFPEEGRYEIILTVDDNEGMPNSVATHTEFLSVVGDPQADAGSNRTVVANQLIEFDGSRSRAADDFLNEFIWDFGDGNTGSGVRPSHRYDRPGTYEVTLTVVGNVIGRCANESTDTILVIVEPEPFAEFFIPDEISVFDELVLDASSSLADGAEIQRFTWTIDSLQTITWSIDSQFDAETQTFSRIWTKRNSNGNTATSQDLSDQGRLPITTINMPAGDYTISLEVEILTSADQNSATDSRMISVSEAPIFTLNATPTLIPGELHRFQPSGRLGRMREQFEAIWDFGDGNTASGFDVTHAFENAGTYTVVFRLDDGRGNPGSVQEMEQEIRVNAPPVPVITGPMRGEPGSRMVFDASDSYVDDGEITEYRWFFSDGFRATGTRVERVFERYGNYSVTLTVLDDAGVANSTQSTTRRLMVSDRPELTMRLPTVVCPGVELDLPDAFSLSPEDSSLVDIFIGNTNIAFADASEMAFQLPGQYNIRVVMHDGSGDPSQAQTFRQSIRVNGTPEVYADVPERIRIGAAGDRAIFDASRSFDPDGDILTFFWDLGDGTRKAGRTITHTYQQPGDYTVRLTVVDDKGLSCSVATRDFNVTVVRD